MEKKREEKWWVRAREKIGKYNVCVWFGSADITRRKCWLLSLPLDTLPLRGVLQKFCITDLSAKNQRVNFKQKKKNSVYTGTCGGSETFLNTVVHENVKVYMNQYVKFFLKFP